MPDDLYPVLLKLVDRDVVVVGAGAVARRKVAGLRGAGARVTVVAPEAVEAVRAWADEGVIRWHRRPFSDDDLDDATLVVAATGDPSVNRAVRDAAHARGLLVNAVDDPPNCDFYLPAVIRRGALIVSISTSGRAPALARALRDELAAAVPASLGTFVDLLGELRDEVRRRLPGDPTGRHRVHLRLLDSGARARVEGGDVDGARRALREALDEAAPRPPAGGPPGGSS